MKSTVRLNLERASSLVTRFVARNWGETFPFYYVMEFPKSGGSWLSDMIADYLQLPRPLRSTMPIGCSAVLHGHWDYSPHYRRVFYLHRDGRDVIVSMFFRYLREVREPSYSSTPSYFLRRFPSLAVKDDPEAIRAALPQFIQENVRHGPGAHCNWTQHIGQWLGKPGVISVSYEDLLEDAVKALARILPVHVPEPIHDERLRATVHKYSFEQQTGRARGAEARGALVRKGVAGDWRNHFTRAAGESFDRAFGPRLIELGYESDRRWIDALPEK